MADKSLESFDQAVARNTAAVLSLPSAGMLRHHKSRFLAACAEGIWIESAPEDRVLIDHLITSKQPAAISFKSGPTKASFAATLLQRQEKYQINADTVVEALLIMRPALVKVIQRRNDYRVRLTQECGVATRVWRIAEKADLHKMPPAAQEIKGQLHDMSLGGLGIQVAQDAPVDPGALPQLSANAPQLRLLMDERLRVEIKSGEHNLLVEGRVRHLPPNNRGGSGAQTRVGVQLKLDNTLEGRQALATLTRIVGQLQREEARRMRLGLVTPDAA